MEGLSETDVVAVEVLGAELAAAVGLVAGSVVDGGATLDEFGVEGVGVRNPEVNVPQFVRDGPEGDDVFGVVCLLEHEVQAVAFEDDEGRGFSPEAFVVEPHFVAVMVGGCDDVFDQQHGCGGGQGGLGLGGGHGEGG